MRRRNGEGTIYRRRDGRYEAATFIRTISGRRKRVRFYAGSYAEARSALRTAHRKVDHGQAIPDQNWRVGDYLDYWLENVARPKVRPKTYLLYESTVRRYLKPGLAPVRLDRLSVQQLQVFFNEQVEKHGTPRTIHLIRTVLSSALGRAMREELVMRNVARLIDLPPWRRKEVQPWTADQVRTFISAAAGDPLYLAFLLLCLYGLRRGEVLGLRWEDVDLKRAEIHVRQQVQRYDGELHVGPVKTEAGERNLPLLPAVGSALALYRNTKLARNESASKEGLVFTTRFGQPIEPGNLLRSFHRICAGLDLPKITLHYLRHTAATLLKDLGVAARDSQAILGHAHVATTQQIYQHSSSIQQRQAIDGVGTILLGVKVGERCRQTLPSNAPFVVEPATFVSGGPGGTRTLDILLKSLAASTGVPELREVLVFARIRTSWALLGIAAVKRCRQTSSIATLETEQRRRSLIQLYLAVQIASEPPELDPAA